ncbi:FAD-binding oxidoreductase [Roseateles aquatilis]|nr:FAD-binding oxidoreductase [Roseateles aquatilis]
MDRRRFLAAGAGALASGWLAGCGGGGGAAGTPVSPPGTPPTSGGPDWSALRPQLQGQLLLPTDVDFNTLRLPANARYDGTVPLALARCARTEDVAAALAFARASQLPFTPRSGGHSYLGASTGTGLIVDTGPMDAVRMDGDIAVVGAGAKLADVYRALLALPSPRVLPSGSCVTVGITGIALGGGFGYFQRLHGLTCDALVGATVVDANGRSLVCDATSNTDLFWALRGGGGGQFGIVTELRFQTRPVTAMSSASVSFAAVDATRALAAWQAWSAAQPDTVWSQGVLGVDFTGTLGLGINAVAMDTADALQATWGPLLTAIGAMPVARTAPQALTAQALLLASCNGLTATQCHLSSQVPGGVLQRVAMSASSDFFNQPLPAAGIQALTDALLARARAGRNSAVILDQMGGAISRVAVDATAFPHRAARFSAQYLTESMRGTSADLLDADARWANGMRDTMKSWSSGGAYVNYPDKAIANPGDAYYGGNLARLQYIRAAVDPNRVFKSGVVSL